MEWNYAIVFLPDCDIYLSETASGIRKKKMWDGTCFSFSGIDFIIGRVLLTKWRQI